jgi:peptidoglycan/LPS O-acetylase OafA/YrhL
VTAARSVARPSTTGARSAPAGPRAWHRRDIEGLRAVAVLLVVLYHCGVPLLGGGYVGVDVFFVISGFLITNLLLREVAGTGTISIAGFYARRFLRLLPAAGLVVAATVAAAWAWLPPLRAPGIALDGLWTALYGINYRLAAVGTDYLNADAAPSPLQHFWSLAVEEQFYVVWPPLLLAAAVLARRAGLRLRPTVAAALGTVVAASLVVSVWQTRANPEWAYFGIHTRAWELGVGALVAIAPVALPRRAAAALTTAGLAGICAAAVGFTARTAFPGYAALLPVLGAAAVLIGGASAPAGLLGTAPLQAVGRLSYSWYLWHWPFLMIAPYALGVSAGVSVNLVVAAAALLAAAATFALVENPVRHLAALRRRPWRAIGAGVAVTVLSASAYLAAAELRHTVGDGYATPVLTATDLTGTRLPGTLAAGAATPAVPANLTPALDRATGDEPRVYPDGCSSQFTDASIKKPCAYGDTASPTTVVLFGDSHAAQWFPALEAVAQQRDWKLVVVTKTACSAASVRIYQATLKRPFDECVRWRESAWGYIASLRPAMVVMSSAAAGGDLADPAQRPDDVWTAGWVRTTEQLAATGAKLYLIDDTPYQSSDTPECLSTHPRDPQACVVAAGRALPQPARRRMVADALTAKGVTVVDPTAWFCTATRCPVIIGNVLVYRDVSHVTATYIRLLAPLLQARLTP